jgi:hypothetical protein
MVDPKGVDPSAGSIRKQDRPIEADEGVEDIELPPEDSAGVLGGQPAPCVGTDIMTQI